MITAPINATASPRDQLVALGRSGSSWLFLEVATQHLTSIPSSDVGVSLLIASHLAKLGLKTMAGETIAALPQSLRVAPEITALERGIAALADDRIPDARVASTFAANMDALGAKLKASERIEPPVGADFFRANDGNVVVRRGGFALVAERKGTSARVLTEHRTVWEQSPFQSLIVAGTRSPWLVQRASGARQRDKLGYRAPIYLIEPDQAAFADAMAMEDLAAELRDGHVHAFVGNGAVQAFADFLRSRIDLRLSGTIATDPGTSASLTSEITTIVRNAIEEQDRETRALQQLLQAKYAGRDAAWWRLRMQDQSRPLRVLIPTSRYSTFVQYSSRDIAAAFIALGHEAHVLIEPDGSSCLAAGASLRALHDFEPDLVVCINYPRDTIGTFLPKNVPWICWIQDLMPHLFDARIGQGLGELDFTIGHVKPALHERYGYPRESSLVLPVPASETKFFPSITTSTDRAKFECEIAYVSHQSETPEAQHDRILAELGSGAPNDSGLKRALPMVRDAVQAHLRLPLSTLPFPSIKDVVRDSLARGLGAPPPELMIDRVVAGYADPLADRIFRHETLEWAAAAARTRGWRFHLYGKGWENHPTLAEFAKGPLGHDSDLPLSYQLAGCHLQSTYHMLAHPRLSECVLSGGTPLCRLHWEELGMIRSELFKLAWHQGAEFRDTSIASAVRRAPWTDAPALMGLASILQNLGCFEEAIEADAVGDCTELSPGTLRGSRWGAMFETSLLRDRSLPGEPELPSAFGILGEQPQLFFHSAATLQGRVAGLIEGADARARRNAVARKRIEERHTYQSAVRRILELVRQRLDAAATARKAANHAS